MTASHAPVPTAPPSAGPLSTSAVDNERRAHEPSMEEILASIRKIIADEETLPASRASATFAEARAANRSLHAAAVEPPSHVEALRADIERASAARAEVNVTPLVAPQRAPETPADRMMDPRVVAPATTEPAAFQPHEALRGARYEAEAPELDDELEAEALADEDFVPLAAGQEYAQEGAHDDNAEEAPILSPSANASVSSAFQTLSASVSLANAEAMERMTREMLRPMLKQWLDDNLPVMVERLVRAEIERVARGGR